MEEIHCAKRRVYAAQKQLASARKSLRAATKRAKKAKWYADRQRAYLEQGGCLCAAMTLFAPYDPQQHGPHSGPKAIATHMDLNERFVTGERLCDCDCKANRRKRGTNLGNIGKEAQPMDVECQRKLTRRAIEEETAALKACNRKAVTTAERELARAKQELEETRLQAGANLVVDIDELDGDKSADFGEIVDGDGSCIVGLGGPLSQLDVDLSTGPLKLVFVDKSASMGCDQNSLRALFLGARNALQPIEGSCMLFLLAGPGETQIYYSRAGDAPQQVEIPLGCSTWFNEPVFLVLKALAPVVESLGTSVGDSSQGLPPLQVVCVTDGMDNQSASFVKDLPSLASAISAITGEDSGEPLYLPLGSWQRHDRERALAAMDKGRIPVWLMWVALSSGAGGLLEQADPGRVAVVDAMHELVSGGTPITAISNCPGGADNVVVGSVVLAPIPTGLEGRERKHKNSIVTAVIASDEEEPQLEVLCVDDGMVHTVPYATVTLQPQTVPRPPPSSATERPAEHVLALVDAAMTRPVDVMRCVDPSSGIVPIDSGAKFFTEEMMARLHTSTTEAPKVQQVDYEPLPPTFVKMVLNAAGSAAASCGVSLSIKEDEAARILILAAMDTLLQDGVVKSFELAQRAKLGISVGCGADGMDRLDRIVRPLEAVLDVLASTGAVIPHDPKQQYCQQQGGKQKHQKYRRGSDSGAAGGKVAAKASAFPAMVGVESWRMALVAVDTIFRSLPSAPMAQCQGILANCRKLACGAPTSAAPRVHRPKSSGGTKAHWTDVISRTSHFVLSQSEPVDKGVAVAASVRSNGTGSILSTRSVGACTKR